MPIIDTKTYANKGVRYSWLEVGQYKNTMVRFPGQGGREDPDMYVWGETLVDTYTDLFIVKKTEYGSPYDTVSIWHIHVPPNFPKSIARCEALKNGGARRNILFQANPSQSTTIKPDRFTTIDTVTYPRAVYIIIEPVPLNEKADSRNE